MHRWVEPHRLVSLGRRWYLVAYDRDRQDWRSFRVDRIAGRRDRAAVPAARAAREGRAEVRAGRLPADAAAVRRPGAVRGVRRRGRAFVGRWAEVEPDGDTACVMTMNTDTLDWPMIVLANVDAEFRIEGPAELVDQVSRGRPDGPVSAS